MSDLVSRLLAAIEETERIARAATPGPWGYEGDDPTDDEVYSVHPDEGEGSAVFGNTVAFTRDRQVPNMVHIAHNDPAAVFRHCAAERDTVEWCEEVIGDRDLSNYGQDGCLKDDPQSLAVTLAVETLKNLERAYGISVEEETTHGGWFGRRPPWWKHAYYRARRWLARVAPREDLILCLQLLGVIGVWLGLVFLFASGFSMGW